MSRRTTPTVTLPGRSGNHLVRPAAIRLVTQSATASYFVRLAFPHGVTKPAGRRARELYALVRAELDRRSSSAARRCPRVPDRREAA